MILIIKGKVFEVKPGDYILYNGACYQFCSGDNRVIHRRGYDEYTSIVMSQKMGIQAALTLPYKGFKDKNGFRYIKFYL